jgi:hypothetical protein
VASLHLKYTEEKRKMAICNCLNISDLRMANSQISSVY